jgi:hypothetical protein
MPVSGFSVRPGALEEFARTAEQAGGQVTPLEPSTALAGVATAVPGTLTAVAASDLAIALTVSCQALGDAVTELAGAARASETGYGGADQSAADLLKTTDPVQVGR